MPSRDRWDLWGPMLTCLGLVLSFAALSRGAEPARPFGGTIQATSAQIAKWVQDLNAERFLDREIATDRLIAVGAPAIEPLLEALGGNNLEVTTRVLHILQELAVGSDVSAAEAARSALERAAQPRGTTAARHAAAMLARLDDILCGRALEEMKKLGAIVRSPTAEMGIVMSDHDVVELGEKWHGAENDLTRLRWLRGIAELALVGPQVTDAWLTRVEAMDDLPALTVKRARVTDEGLRHLAGLKKLQSLNLLYVPVGDGVVAHLKGLDGLGTIRLYGTRITDRGAEQLRQALVGTKVDFRRGAFLGIGCEPVPQGCMIFLVRPGSAAEKAGLLVNDVVLQYEDKPVPDFTKLTELIAQNRPGDRVTVKILRGEARMDKQVTLGEWD